MTPEEIFCNEYVDKIYYYCLKKTGSVEAAEDLAGEISVEVLHFISKGIIPEHFSGYVWQIVRNRYARWAKQKHIVSEHEEIPDEKTYMEFAGNENIEFDYIKRETLNELRRELSLVAKEYREILVAYYMKNMSIKEIAKNLLIPEGTVKTKLYKGRQRLKEGMNMARTFGTLSYAPEEIDFSMSGGSSADNVPDKFLWDEAICKITKNIMIEAYKNPSTMEELSLELGIAVPYLEDIVEALCDATLMVKTGVKGTNIKYETNFAIISAEARRKMEDKLAGIQRELVQHAKEYLEKSRVLQLEAGNEILGPYQDYEGQKWTLTCRLADDLQWGVYKQRNCEFFYDTKRPNGGTWDVMGYQKYEGPHFMWVGHSCAQNDEEQILNIFCFKEWDEEEEKKLSVLRCRNVEILYQILDGKFEASEAEYKILEQGGFIRKNKDGQYEVTFGVYTKSHNSDTLRYAVPVEIYQSQLQPIWEKMMALVNDYIGYCEEVMRKEIPKQHMDKFNFYMHSVPFIRGALLEGLMETRFLKKLEERPAMAGVYLEKTDW